jgi:uncharacterized membrane protein
MNKARLESFTDAVMAIAMTVMVLGIAPPLGEGFGELWGLRYQFIVYAISFFTLAIYWKNHHHLFVGERQVSGKVLMLNIVLVFVLTLFPFVTAWVGVERNIYALAPELTFGLVMLVSNICFLVLDREVARVNKSKAVFSGARAGTTMVINILSLGLCVVYPPSVLIGRVMILGMWVLPPKR